MNKLNVLFSVLATVLILMTTSCGSSDNKEENTQEDILKDMVEAVNEDIGEIEEVDVSAISNADNAKIAGEWKVIKAEGDAGSANEGKTYNFKEDGSATINGVNYNAYNLGGTNLTMDLNGMEEMYTKWTVTFESDEKITMETTNVKVWLEKQ